MKLIVAVNAKTLNSTSLGSMSKDGNVMQSSLGMKATQSGILASTREKRCRPSYSSYKTHRNSGISDATVQCPQLAAASAYVGIPFELDDISSE